MRCRLNRVRRSSWIATTISSPFSRQAEPLCEALIPRIHGCIVHESHKVSSRCTDRTNLLGEEFNETLVSLSGFTHFLVVTLRKRAYVALTERANPACRALRADRNRGK